MLQKPYRLTFVMLSFEGPDPYSMAGGLSTRVIGLTDTLARLGFETHLIFIGDPKRPSHEIQQDGKLHLHRWGQWVSQYYPGGVYEGEEGKLRDYQDSVPDFMWDFETFGEHHRLESGIFDFLRCFPREAATRGLTFLSVSEVLDHYREQAFQLPLPAFPTTWAGSGGMEFFLGNSVQQAVFQLMAHAYNKALLTGDPELIDLAIWLCQSDNLHLIQWYGRSGAEAEVSAYFTPREWWKLGPQGIAWEVQQVYKNWIAALDPYLTHFYCPNEESGHDRMSTSNLELVSEHKAACTYKPASVP